MSGPGWKQWVLALLVGVAMGLACGYDSSLPEEASEVADAGAVPGGADGSTGSPDAGGADGGTPDSGTPGGAPDSGTPGGRCTSAAACDDQNPCTEDTCTLEGQCLNAAVDGGCVQGGRTGCCDKGLCCVGPLCCQ